MIRWIVFAALLLASAAHAQPVPWTSSPSVDVELLLHAGDSHSNVADSTLETFEVDLGGTETTLSAGSVTAPASRAFSLDHDFGSVDLLLDAPGFAPADVADTITLAVTLTGNTVVSAPAGSFAAVDPWSLETAREVTAITVTLDALVLDVTVDDGDPISVPLEDLVLGWTIQPSYNDTASPSLRSTNLRCGGCVLRLDLLDELAPALGGRIVRGSSDPVHLLLRAQTLRTPPPE